MKYKSLEKNYRKMDSQQHEEDEMKVVYHGDMQAGKCTWMFTIIIFVKRNNSFCPFRLGNGNGGGVIFEKIEKNYDLKRISKLKLISALVWVADCLVRV